MTGPTIGNHEAEDSTVEWNSLVDEMVVIRQQMSAADRGALWTYCPPARANTAEEVLAAAAAVGETTLDASYESLLLVAGGWQGFYQEVDLFGALDFGGPRYRAAEEQLGWIEQSVFDRIGLARSHVYPIAASRSDLDVFVIVRQAASTAGHVWWLAGGETERFTDLRAFFLTMMQHNRHELRRLTG